MTPKRSRYLMWAGCAIIAVGMVGIAAGVSLIVAGIQRGPGWMVHAGIAVLAVALVIGLLGSTANLIGFSHQLAGRWRRR